MSEFQKALDTVGVGGVLWALRHCLPADLEIATSDAARVMPETIARQTAQLWKLGIQKSVIMMMQERDIRRILLLGNDTAFLEALDAIEFFGGIEVLLPPHVSPDEVRKVAQNVPRGLDVAVLTPGLVPVLHAANTVIAIGFDAGGGYLMVDEAAARALGSIRGQRFTGDVIGLQPLSGVTVHERQINWQMVPRSQFTDVCDPEGLEPVIPNI